MKDTTLASTVTDIFLGLGHINDARPSLTITTAIISQPPEIPWSTKKHDPKLERRRKKSHHVPRLPAKDKLPDFESFKGADWLKEVQATMCWNCSEQESRKLHGRQMYSTSSTDICTVKTLYPSYPCNQHIHQPIPTQFLWIW